MNGNNTLKAQVHAAAAAAALAIDTTTDAVEKHMLQDAFNTLTGVISRINIREEKQAKKRRGES